MALTNVTVSRVPLNLGQIFSGAVAILLVALPVARSASAARSFGGTAFPSVITYVIPVFIATLCFALFTINADSFNRRDNPIWPKQQVGGGLFVSLLAWLLIVHLRVGELDAARNMAMILVTFVVLLIAKEQGLAISQLFRSVTRLSVVYSIVMYLMSPVWFVNSSAHYFDPGKIVSTVPNIQGILNHPNATALYFSAALIIEVALWGYRSRKSISVLFLTLCAILLVTTQSRTAILATALAIACVVGYRRGKPVWAFAGFLVSFVALWVPFALMAPAFLIGAIPDYDWLPAIATRGALWTAIVEVLPDTVLWGQGSAAVARTHSIVTDPNTADVVHAHNQILNLLLVGGLFAALLFAALFCAIASRIRSGRPAAEGVGLAIILAFTGITETPLTPYITQPGVVIFIIAVALLFSSPDSDARQYNSRHRSTESRRPASAASHIDAQSGLAQ